LKYLISNFGHYEERSESQFVDVTQGVLRDYMKTNGNKYCFFEIILNGKALDRIVFELFYSQLPKTCENFLSLCEGFRNERGNKLWYKNSIFHRIVKNGYIQGGDLSNSTSKIFYFLLNFIEGAKSIYNGDFSDESYNIQHSYPGILGMVKKGNKKHSNECQFYITLSIMKSFDQMFVAFGRVIQGFRSLKEMEKLETTLQKPNVKVSIDSCGIFQI
jgi:peptidyl-prolyl cis-trans isomerase-like 6